MIELLAEYGLFLAKAITIVMAILFVISGIASLAARNRGGDDHDGTLRVKHVNRDVESLRDDLRHEVMPPHLRKLDLKEQKKKEKARRKEEKKGKQPDEHRPRLFVLDFDGDLDASGVENLRREISALLQIADQRDEVVVRLESPGGLVHSYGLAASQLDRIRNRGIRLTVCVDKVAASGGYMMACIADRIVAAPFAVVGSVGVVAQIPNFHRLLKKHDVDVELHTAGEFKRTLTMFGENTEKGREKFQEELEDTHALFKEFVHSHRAGLDVDQVATGEHWFGIRAKELGLVDELMTSDEYLMQCCDGADVYELHWEVKRKLAERLGLAVEGSIRRSLGALLQRSAGRWFQ